MAGVLLLVLVGFTLHGFLRRVGASQGLSSSLAILVLYFSLAAISPELLVSVLERLPWLSIVPLIAFVLALWQVGRLALKGSTTKALEGVQELQQSAPAKTFQKKLAERSEDKQALQAAKSVIAELSGKENKQSEEIIRDLEQVEEVIKRYGDQSKVRSFVSQKLRGVLPKSHALSVEMNRRKELDRHLMKGDYSLYKALQERVSGLEGEERKAFEQRLRDEVQRIRSEWHSEKAEEHVQSDQREGQNLKGYFCES